MSKRLRARNRNVAAGLGRAPAWIVKLFEEIGLCASDAPDTVSAGKGDAFTSIAPVEKQSPNDVCSAKHGG